MREFLKRISSRKFLTALAVQIAAVVALFRPPGEAGSIQAAAVQIAALAALVAAALGYGAIEGAIDKEGATNGNGNGNGQAGGPEQGGAGPGD